MTLPAAIAHLPLRVVHAGTVDAHQIFHSAPSRQPSHKAEAIICHMHTKQTVPVWLLSYSQLRTRQNGQKESHTASGAKATHLLKACRI